MYTSKSVAHRTGDRILRTAKTNHRKRSHSSGVPNVQALLEHQHVAFEQELAKAPATVRRTVRVALQRDTVRLLLKYRLALYAA